MLKVYYSNRLENLLERLVEVTATPPAHPLAPEVVVTQSHGMARWLTLGLAEQRSLAANIKFVLPASFVWGLFADHLAGTADTSAFDREVLAWRLMQLLPDKLEEEGFEPLRRYLQGARPELKRYQLCGRIADVFDQYLIYRPDFIHDWEAGKGEDWQARLWRALAEGGELHRAALLGRFLDDTLRLDAGRLPARVCLFGIPSLPPAYLQVLARLARATEVHLFALNPCLLYWGDIEDPRRIARFRLQRERLGRALEEDYLTSGNSLLASLGRQGRDFYELLNETVVTGEEELFEAPPSSGLLGLIQSDILLLEDRRRDPDKPRLDPDDRSVQLHVCHSPMREVEVLHDRLLQLFDTDSTLRPQDVVVMAPDIEQYAPFIMAVFGAAPEARRLPWSIADLSRKAEQPLVNTFLQLLDLPRSRFVASEVLSFLEVPAVLRRFGLEVDDFETLRQWVKESGIRWGVDASSRGALALPELNTNTWDFGFRRMLLGYAMAPGEERLCDGIVPYTRVEGQSAELLGRLRRFVERLEHFARRLGGSHTAVQWVALGNELLDALFHADGDDAEPLQVVRDTLADLVETTARAGFGEAFGVDVLRAHLAAQLETAAAEQRFLSGRITFCSMIPMRSLPFRVVAMLGMNDGAFPRQRRPLGFDKMAAAPRRGDRSRREDDRYLFLEALISARDLLYISYVGRDIRDNHPLLPSVLVSELLDYIDESFVPGARPLVTEHPLQPFSRRHFEGDGRLASYAEEWLPVVRAAAGERRADSPFCPELLPERVPLGEAIELEAVCRFFQHPAQDFLRRRLGVWLEEDQEVVDDSEPFALDGLQNYHLRDELLDRLLDGGDADAWRALAKARGQLPGSSFADLWLDGEVPEVEKLAEVVRARLAQPLPVAEVDLAGPEWRLVGWLDGLTVDGLLRYRVGNARSKYLVDLWIRHLALNALAPLDCVPQSRMVARDGEFRLAPVKNAAELLSALIALYRRGQSAPLPFFPDSSRAWVKAEQAGKSGVDAATVAWNGGYNKSGEGSDPYYRIAFAGSEPLDEAFEAIARQVWTPLLAVLNAEVDPDAAA